MAWAKVDDTFHDHPKALDVGLRGRALFIAGLCWSAKHLTDGHLPRAAIASIAHQAGVRVSTADALVKAGLWEPNGDGWEIHDYLLYNPSKAEVEKKRAKWAKDKKAQREGGDS